MKEKILWNIVLLIMLLSVSVSVSADNTLEAEVYGQDIQVEDDSEISVPIYIRNNPGIKGYIFNFSYDPKFMEPVFVERGDILAEGNFNDDIEGSTSTEGQFKVVWNHVSALSDNGLLFKLHFRLNENAAGVSTIQTGVDQDNTYNQEYEFLDLATREIHIKTTKFGNPDFVLPNSLESVENNAFEEVKAAVIYVPDTCKSIGNQAFYNSQIIQIRIPADCMLGEDVFEGCENVMVFGTVGSNAERYCDSHMNCTFVEE